MAVYNQTALDIWEKNCRDWSQWLTSRLVYLEFLFIYLFIFFIFISDIFCNSVLISVLTAVASLILFYI